MLRIKTMGFESSVSRDPTQEEIADMQGRLREGLKLGYAGFEM